MGSFFFTVFVPVNKQNARASRDLGSASHGIPFRIPMKSGWDADLNEANKLETFPLEEKT